MGACNRYTFEAVWLSLQQFSHGVLLLIPIFAAFGLDCSASCRSVRRGPPRTNFFSRTNIYVIDLPSGVSNVDSTLTRAAQAPFAIRLLVSYSTIVLLVTGCLSQAERLFQHFIYRRWNTARAFTSVLQPGEAYPTSFQNTTSLPTICAEALVILYGNITEDY